jgi:hypothetical protein
MLKFLDMSILSLIISVISAILAYTSYKLNKKQIRISHTPILLPIIRKTGVNNFNIFLSNNSKEDTLQSVNLEIKNGKLQTSFNISNEFLAPDTSTKQVVINQDIDGSCFIIKYEGIVGSMVEIKGRIHVVGEQLFDFQEVNLKWGSNWLTNLF